MEETEITGVDVAPAAKVLGPKIVDVVCDACGHGTQIMDHPVAGHEQRWQCDCAVSYVIVGGEKQATKESGLCECAAPNVIPGAPGEPGEGALNPAAAALSDEEILEAATRRGILHKLDLGGGVGPAGDAAGGTV